LRCFDLGSPDFGVNVNGLIGEFLVKFGGSPISGSLLELGEYVNVDRD